MMLMQTFLKCINTKELSAALINSWKSVSCFQLASLSTIFFADLLKICSTCFQSRESLEHPWDTVQWRKEESRLILLNFITISKSIASVRQGT